MTRTLWFVFCACSVAVVLSETTALGFLWSQGQLTAQRLRDIRDLFGPQEKEAVASGAETQQVVPSSQDVLKERSLRVLSLNSLETEAGLLKTMLDTERNALMARHAEFDRQKNEFKNHLQQLADENTVAAREQARAVLLAMPAGDAVGRLLQLSIEEDVLLLREMPEAKIAALLKELSPAPESPTEGPAGAAKPASSRQQRAKDIFERLTKGEPRGSIIRSALDRLQQSDADRPAVTNNK